MKTHTQHELTTGGGVEDLYDAKVLGAPFKVFLSDGFEIKTDPVSGKAVTEIHDLPGLIAAVVKSRIFHERKLSGKDLKFIRSAMGVKSSLIASKIDITPEHYSRCENGTKTMSVSQERIYRMFVFFCMTMRDKEVVEALERAKSKLPEKTMTPDESKKALEALRMMFFDMKINPAYAPDDELKFSFTRRVCRENDGPCEDNGDWNSNSDIPNAA